MHISSGHVKVKAQVEGSVDVERIRMRAVVVRGVVVVVVVVVLLALPLPVRGQDSPSDCWSSLKEEKEAQSPLPSLRDLNNMGVFIAQFVKVIGVTMSAIIILAYVRHSVCHSVIYQFSSYPTFKQSVNKSFSQKNCQLFRHPFNHSFRHYKQSQSAVHCVSQSISSSFNHPS